MTKPFTPEEAVEAKLAAIPSFVFEAFNSLIAEKLSNGKATVTKDEAIARIIETALTSANEVYSRKCVISKGWLDVEPHYCKAGWDVFYDRPAYYEMYKPFFVFTKS